MGAPLVFVGLLRKLLPDRPHAGQRKIARRWRSRPFNAEDTEEAKLTEGRLAASRVRIDGRFATVRNQVLGGRRTEVGANLSVISAALRDLRV
jgi:hypothetical protein